MEENPRIDILNLNELDYNLQKEFFSNTSCKCGKVIMLTSEKIGISIYHGKIILCLECYTKMMEDMNIINQNLVDEGFLYINGKGVFEYLNGD
jgi:hypothetical protein